MTNKNMSQEDETILMFAFRYALGRKSSAPSYMVDVLIKNWKNINEQMKIQIRDEIKTAIKRGEAGMDCDVKTWQRITKLNVKEEV